MKLLTILAWRNLWRHARRTVLTILAVFFATFLTVVMRGLTIGTWEFNVKNSVEMFSGYLQVQRTGYQDSPSLQKCFAYDSALQARIMAVPRVHALAPRVQADGLVSCRGNSSGGIVLGIDPASEQRISRFAQRVNAGTFFGLGSTDEVVVGYRLMENLRARIGDTIVVLAQGYDGVMGNQKFRVSGTVKLGAPEFDDMAVLMDIRAAQGLLALEGRVHVLAIALATLKDIEPARRAIASLLPDDGTRSVLSWDEVLPELRQAMDLDQATGWLFLGILIVVVAFGILNTVLMSVTERFREFGVSLAVGMRPGRLARLVALETAFLAAIGIASGALLGWLVNLYVALNPILLTGEFGAIYEEYGFVPQLMATASPEVVTLVCWIMLLVSFLAGLYPAYRVLKLEPLKGMRYT